MCAVSRLLSARPGGRKTRKNDCIATGCLLPARASQAKEEIAAHPPNDQRDTQGPKGKQAADLVHKLRARMRACVNGAAAGKESRGAFFLPKQYAISNTYSIGRFLLCHSLRGAYAKLNHFYWFDHFMSVKSTGTELLTQSAPGYFLFANILKVPLQRPSEVEVQGCVA